MRTTDRRRPSRPVTRRSTSRRRELLLNVGIALLVLIVLGVLLEILGHFLLAAQTERMLAETGRTAEQQARGEFFARGGYVEFSPYRIGELKPGLVTPYFSIDEEGFRTTLPTGAGSDTTDAASNEVNGIHDSPSIEADGRQHVFLVGGSTTFGVGVGDNETIAAYLQDCLDRREPNTYRVVNAGVTGYSSTEELLYLVTDIRFRDPDTVVFVDGRNDIYFSTFPAWEHDAPHQAIAALRRLADDAGFAYLDLTAVFDGIAEQKYLDDCHYTPAANEILAERICAHIR